MAKTWYIRKQNGHTEGPFSSLQLQDLASQKIVSPVDQVSYDQIRWHHASKVKGLKFESSKSELISTKIENINPSTIVPTIQKSKSTELTISGYDIHKLIGQGAFGKVYQATQKTLQREVAIKCISLENISSISSISRFEKEAVSLAKLKHPNIVTIYDYGFQTIKNSADESVKHVHMVMELLEGQDLEQHLEAKKKLNEKETWLIIKQVAMALNYVKKSGIIHRDIKPANIFILQNKLDHDNTDSENLQVKVMDFGLAMVQQTNNQDNAKITQMGMFVGTPAYMAPEQFSGSEVDHRADIYALGATAFQCLFGQLPFESKNVWEMMVLKNDSMVNVPNGISSLSGELIKDLLTQSPSNRIQTYDILIQRIDEIFDGEHSKQPRKNKTKKVNKKTVYIGSAIAASLLLIAFGLSYIFAGSSFRELSGKASAKSSIGDIESYISSNSLLLWTVNGTSQFVKDKEKIDVLELKGHAKLSKPIAQNMRFSVAVNPLQSEHFYIFFQKLDTNEYSCIEYDRVKGVSVGTYDISDKKYKQISKKSHVVKIDEDSTPYINFEIELYNNRWDISVANESLGGFNLVGQSNHIEIYSFEHLQISQVESVPLK